MNYSNKKLKLPYTLSEIEIGNKKWEPKALRFVGFFDILGFKEFVLRNNIEAVHKMLYDMVKVFPDYIPTESGKVIKSESQIMCVNFSDSVFVFTKSDSPGDFLYFTNFISYFMRHALKNDIPLKGSIAYGETYAYKNKQLFCGEPIVNVYLLEEELQYMGIVVHHSVEQYIKNRIIDIGDERKELTNLYYKEITTDFKYGKRVHINLDYTILSEKYTTDMISIIEKRKLITSGEPRKYIDNTINILSQFKKKNEKLENVILNDI